MSAQVRNQLFIHGEWVTPAQQLTEAVINPADGSLLCEAVMAGPSEVDSAIHAARVAFDRGNWSGLTMEARAQHLQSFFQRLMEDKERIVSLIVAEAGATQMLASLLHFDTSMKHAQQLISDALLIKPEHAPLELSPAMDGTTTLGAGSIVYEGVGVVAAITAYNFPFFLNVIKVFHALLMGNTMVLKPSPFTPLQAFVMAEAAEASGLPAGVLNIVNGGVEVGEALTTDPRVDMVTFTGSDKVGALIMAQGAPTLKRMHMELGGKSAMIIRDDADLQLAAQAGLASFTIQAGQGCALTTRHLVHNSVRTQYVEMLRQMVSHVRVGNPADPAVTMGPLIRASARDRVERYIQAGIDSGATLVTGGSRPEGLDAGFYLQPTLFDNVDNQSRIAQEEIFGPVAAVIGFDNDEEAIGLANDSDFGLAGMIYSRDAGRAYEMALQIRTGGVAINGGAGAMLSGAPFGGYKRSGFGRELGRHGLMDFAQSKVITFQAR